MIRKVKDELICECNDCGNEHYGGCNDDWKAFIQELKDMGWEIKKDGDEWRHLCASCVEGT